MPGPSENLCLACGMCCDGSLHNFTHLRTEEVIQAGKLGLRVAKVRQGTPIIWQPCKAYTRPDCRVYLDRPRACRQYRCKLLNALESDSLDLSEALECVRKVQDQIAALRSQMPDPDLHFSLSRQIRINWLDRSTLPMPAAEIFSRLAGLMQDHFGVRVNFSPIRSRKQFLRWKRLLRSKGFRVQF